MRLGERKVSECHNPTPNGREAVTAYVIVAYLAHNCEPVTLPCRNPSIGSQVKYWSKGRSFARVAGGRVPRKGTYAVPVASVAWVRNPQHALVAREWKFLPGTGHYA